MNIGDRVRINAEKSEYDYARRRHGLLGTVDFVDDPTTHIWSVGVKLDSDEWGGVFAPSELEPADGIPFDGSIPQTEETVADDAPFTERPE